MQEVVDSTHENQFLPLLMRDWTSTFSFVHIKCLQMTYDIQSSYDIYDNL